ncbi:hypothetical protein EV127DRAFT_411324 [Xylaria flabelliformis]|nr:hypothetical protein EV127DRAFT_411324 [Xylaria flabelliformis]
MISVGWQAGNGVQRYDLRYAVSVTDILLVLIARLFSFGYRPLQMLVIVTFLYPISYVCNRNTFQCILFDVKHTHARARRTSAHPCQHSSRYATPPVADLRKRLGLVSDGSYIAPGSTLLWVTRTWVAATAQPWYPNPRHRFRFANSVVIAKNYTRCISSVPIQGLTSDSIQGICLHFRMAFCISSNVLIEPGRGGDRATPFSTEIYTSRSPTLQLTIHANGSWQGPQRGFHSNPSAKLGTDVNDKSSLIQSGHLPAPGR